MAHDFCIFRLAALFPISKHSAILNTYMFRDQLITGMIMQHIFGITSSHWPIIHHVDRHSDSLRKEVFALLFLLATAGPSPALSTG